MVKPCGLTSASLVVELFSMQVCFSIDWVARHMIEMCTLEGKHLVCINRETLDTLEKMYGQRHDHVWFLYDALSIHGGAWDNHLCLHSSSDVRASANLHMDFHTLKRLNIMWSHIKKFHAWWENLKAI